MRVHVSRGMSKLSISVPCQGSLAVASADAAQGARSTPLVERGLDKWALVTLCRDLRRGLTARLEVLLDAYAQRFVAQYGIDEPVDCHPPLSLLVDLHCQAVADYPRISRSSLG